MITRIRIEGESESKLDLLEELANKGRDVIKLVDPRPEGRWFMTDDVTSFDRDRGLHKGRVVFSKK